MFQVLLFAANKTNRMRELTKSVSLCVCMLYNFSVFARGPETDWFIDKEKNSLPANEINIKAQHHISRGKTTNTNTKKAV